MRSEVLGQVYRLGNMIVEKKAEVVRLQAEILALEMELRELNDRETTFQLNSEI